MVAKEGSIKNAAERLHVSQPTISDQIKLLEDFFDSKLFERRNRLLILNKQGELALKYAENIFDLSNELSSRLKNKLHLPKTSIDIGITHFMSQYFIYNNIVPLFHQKGVTVNIKEGERHLLFAELEQNNLDIVFVDNKDALPSSLDSYRVGVNKTFAIAHKKLKKSRKPFPENLKNIPFLNYTNESFLKYEIELFFKKNKITPPVVGEANDIDLFQVVTDQAIAFVIVPEVAKNRICKNKDIRVLGELEELQTSVWAVVKEGYRGPGYQLLKNKL